MKKKIKIKVNERAKKLKTANTGCKIIITFVSCA